MLPISKASAHSYSLSVQYKLPQFSISYRCFIKTCLSVTVLPVVWIVCLILSVPEFQTVALLIDHTAFNSAYSHWLFAFCFFFQLLSSCNKVLADNKISWCFIFSTKCFSVACGLNVPYRWKKLRQDFIQRTEPESLCHRAVCLIIRPPSVTVNPPLVPAAINATLVLYVED